LENVAGCPLGIAAMGGAMLPPNEGLHPGGLITLSSADDDCASMLDIPEQTKTPSRETHPLRFTHDSAI